MQGVGYYLSDNCVIFENNHDYDSWEYFTGNLKDKERILKTISSLMKDKIGIELFIDTYEYLKLDDLKRKLTSYFTEEGLKLAGLDNEDTNKKIMLKNREYKNSLFHTW